MKCQSKNRPSPFPGQMLQEATKPFCVFGILCVFVFLGYYFMLSVRVQMIVWEDRPQMTHYVSR